MANAECAHIQGNQWLIWCLPLCEEGRYIGGRLDFQFQCLICSNNSVS